MKKHERITKRIQEDKDLMRKLSKMSYYEIDRFIDDGERYIRAIKEGRMICSIDKVSASGMSRTLRFVEMSKSKYENRYFIMNFFQLFSALQFQNAGGVSPYFRIHGCGMDMVFHTNYTIIHKLRRLGFISKEQCGSLAQQTPDVI